VAHWGFPDPAAAIGDEATRRRAFDRVFEMIEPRVRALAALPVETLDGAAFAVALASPAPECAHG
jgi:arsenate reductase